MLPLTLTKRSTSKYTYGNPTYTWATDYLSCTAERLCNEDSSLNETETVNSTSDVIKTPTYTEDGLTVYTATFTNEAFKAQTKTVTIEKLVYYGEFPILSEDGETLTCGLYPQTNVNDPDLVTALNELTTPESNGYYFYNRYYYAKVSASPCSTAYKFDNGTEIVSGTTYWFKCEPIVWNVLSNNSGEYYILSSVLLDSHCYYNSTSNRTIDGKTVYPNNYEYSDIRTWLNNDFYNSAFALGNTHILSIIVLLQLIRQLILILAIMPKTKSFCQAIKITSTPVMAFQHQLVQQTQENVGLLIGREQEEHITTPTLHISTMVTIGPVPLAATAPTARGASTTTAISTTASSTSRASACAQLLQSKLLNF